MGLVYTVIQHGFRKQKNLTNNDYVLCDMISFLTKKIDSKVPGWCYMSRETIADELGLSKRTVINMINDLIGKNLLEKHEITGHLRSTIEWEKVYYSHGAEIAHPVQEMSNDSAKIAPNNIYNNKNISKDIYESNNKKNESLLFDELPHKQPKKEKEEKPSKENFTTFHFRKRLIDMGAEPLHVDDWIKIRKNKKATNTETALNSFIKQCTDNKFSIKDAVRICAENDWKGFKYSWIKEQQENNKIQDDDKIYM